MSDVSIYLWADVASQERAQRDIDEIFFESSAVKSFADDAARSIFHERWLGRYIQHYPDWFYVAVCEDDRVAGYLAGCVADVRETDMFSDISYFKTFSEHLDSYPAHLHVNLAAAFRSQGIGARLVRRFLQDVVCSGGAGVHVVTGEKSRNVAFYERCGFRRIDAAEFNGGSSVFLGARL